MGSTRETKDITKNRGVFTYTRSIPSDVRHLDIRPNPIQKSLKTKNLDMAMSRRDALADADEETVALLTRCCDQQSDQGATGHCQ